MPAWRMTIFTMTCIALFFLEGISQIPCHNPGQTPATAFPVCGKGVTRYASYDYCGGRRVLPNPCPGFNDFGPAYFKFTCYKSGTIGFIITPIQMSDYDWALFDITGVVPDAIYSGQGLAIASNLSGIVGSTGAGPQGQSLHECTGTSYPPFSAMPQLAENHQYLLLVSNWLETASIFTLEFKWGTADIGDHSPILPDALMAGCDGSRFIISLSKKVLCSSVAADGSDWKFDDESIKIASAFGAGCATNYDTDTIFLTLETPLPPGNYSLRSKTGTDGNTLMDSCGNMLAEAQKLSATVPAFVAPAVMESVVPVGCLPTSLDVTMNSHVLCNGIARDGSDFEISGPGGQVKVKMAASITPCMGDSSRQIRLYLQDPIITGGLYTISLRRGTDGSTLLNTCHGESPPGSSISFTGYSKVLAAFNYWVHRGCSADTILFVHPGGNGVNTWKWYENDQPVLGNQPSFTRIYPNAMHEFKVSMSLFVTNGTCKDSIQIPVFLPDIRVKAAFEAPENLCPGDSFLLINKSTGPVVSWLWNLGNGRTSSLQMPPVQYYQDYNALSAATVSLTVSNEIRCTHSFQHQIKIYQNCNLAVPSAFTPNGDNLNDFLYPLNAWRVSNLRFMVYDRYGQLIWESTNPEQKWDGKIAGRQVAAGVYAWVLQYAEPETGSMTIKKGTTVLIR